MPSPMKRASSLRRLLAALRPPPPPVQTGFPTSLADLVVQNHGRLRSRRQQRPLAPTPSSPAPVAAAAEPPPSPSPPPSSRALPPGRPEVLVGGAVAVALLAVWSEALVAAVTVAALSLLWIETSAAAASSRRQRFPAEDSSGRGHVSPNREAEDEAATWSSSFSDSDKGTAERPELVEQVPPEMRKKKKKKKRSLRKLLSNKFHGVKKKHEAKEEEELDLSSVPSAVEQTPAESSGESSSSPPPESSAASEVPVVVDGGGGEFKMKLPLAAFIPVILAGLVLVGGKLPATALAVLCAAFFSGAVDRSKVYYVAREGSLDDPLETEGELD